MPASIRAKSGRFWTLRRIVVFLSVLASLAVGASQFWMFERFQGFAAGNANASSAELLRFLIRDRISKQYDQIIGPIVANWVREKRLAQSVKEGNAKAIQASADAFHRNKEVTQNQILLRNVVLYDLNMTPLTHSSKGSGETVTSRPEVLTQLAKRDKAAQRRRVDYNWMSSDGRPLHSMILPAGGFRAVGFVELVTDPLSYISDLGQVVDGDITITDESGRTLLDESGAVLFESLSASSAEVREQLQALETSSPPPSDAAAAKESGAPEGSENGGRIIDGDETEAKGETARAAEPVLDSHNRAVIDFAVPGSFDDPWIRAKLVRDNTVFADGMTRMRNDAIEMLAAVVLLLWLSGWLLLRFAVFNKLEAFAGAMTNISDGRTEIEIPPSGPDEFRHMGRALDKLRENVRSVMRLKNMVETNPVRTLLIDRDGRIAFANRAARGALGNDATCEVEVSGQSCDLFGLGAGFVAEVTDESRLPLHRTIESEGLVYQIAVSAVQDDDGRFLNSMMTWSEITEQEENRRLSMELMTEVERVSGMVAEQARVLEEHSAALADQSVQTVEHSKDAGGIARDASQLAQSAAGVSEQMTANVDDVSERAQKARSTVIDALAALEQGNEALGELRQSSDNINQVVELIAQITGQTKLLALNATIEAAGAGEAGRGFAVVASEVKALAGQTEKSTEQISGMVSAIQSQVNSTAVTMERVREVMKRVEDIQNAIAQAVTEQTRSAHGISENVVEIASGSTRMSRIIEQVHVQADNTGGTARTLLDASRGLASEAQSLSTRISEFQTRLASL